MHRERVSRNTEPRRDGLRCLHAGHRRPRASNVRHRSQPEPCLHVVHDLRAREDADVLPRHPHRQHRRRGAHHRDTWREPCQRRRHCVLPRIQWNTPRTKCRRGSGLHLRDFSRGGAAQLLDWGGTAGPLALAGRMALQVAMDAKRHKGAVLLAVTGPEALMARGLTAVRGRGRRWTGQTLDAPLRLALPLESLVGGLGPVPAGRHPGVHHPRRWQPDRRRAVRGGASARRSQKAKAREHRARMGERGCDGLQAPRSGRHESGRERRAADTGEVGAGTGMVIGARVVDARAGVADGGAQEHRRGERRSAG